MTNPPQSATRATGKSTAPSTPVDQPMIDAMDQLILDAGGDPGEVGGKNIREMLHTALKLVRDGSEPGEVKLISRSLKELRYALKVFRPYRRTPKVSIFGSARTPEDHPEYRAAVDFSQRMAGRGWMVITGAGDGIMRAGHGGAGREASFGVAIRLPFETNANDVIAGDAKLITFRYFFTRKLMFMWESSAVTLFPGGFGTMDEGFEALTLIQTGKAPMVPIVMIDAPGGDYWKHWDRYVTHSLLEQGWISPADKSLYFITDDVEAAAEHVIGFYRNYHSQRFVRDTLVLRLKRPIAEGQLAALNREYSDLIVSDQIRQGQALKQETDFPELPRLWFHHTKHGYGRLRQMIDRINAFDRENHDAPPTSPQRDGV